MISWFDWVWDELWVWFCVGGRSEFVVLVKVYCELVLMIISDVWRFILSMAAYLWVIKIMLS